MAYGHSSALPPKEAPIMIADKSKVFFIFSAIADGDDLVQERTALHCLQIQKLCSHIGNFLEAS